MIPLWLGAGLWGLLAGGALVIGALAGFFLRVPTWLIAAVMAFGSGVLIAALSFELVGEAVERGGVVSTSVGFLVGAAIYSAANAILARRGAKHRSRSGTKQTSEQEQSGSGAAIAVGALLDGIPESIALGLGMLAGESVGVAMLAAIFLSNLPEGLSSAAGMKVSGRSGTYIFGLWIAIALVSGVAAVAGVVFFDGASGAVIAATMALAAGAMLAMIADTMIPEAFENAHAWTGIVTVLGFLLAFVIGRVGG